MKMVDFMVLGLPRTATTWISNWLTTDTSLCLHDPLYKYHYSALDSIETNKRLGISCTGLYNFPSYVNAHKAKKIIIHRNLNEINESLVAIGLPSLSQQEEDKLYKLQGIHINLEDVFSNPKLVFEYLLEKQFDAERFNELKTIEMQPHFYGLTINKNVTKRLMDELKEGN